MGSANESLRINGEWIVVCDAPDICLTPIGPSMVPVPYQIIARGGDSNALSSSVNMTADRVFHSKSHLSAVYGDEPGTGGGIISGVNRGVCYPLSWSGTVRVQSNPLVRHDDLFAMNASAPGSLYNVTGHAVWMSTGDIEDDSSETANDRGVDNDGTTKNASEEAAKSPEPTKNSQSGAGEKETTWWEGKKAKLDELNKEFHKSENLFAKGMSRFGDTLKDAYNHGFAQNATGFGSSRGVMQDLDDFGSSLGNTLKDNGANLLTLPKRFFTAPIDTLIDMGAGVAKGVPNAIGNFLNDMADGNPGKALGSVAGNLISDKAKDKLTKATGFAGKPEEQLEHAEGRVSATKQKMQETEAQLASVNKSMRKGGRVLKGSPAKRKQKADILEANKAKKAELSQQHSEQQAAFEKSKEKLESAESRYEDSQSTLYGRVASKYAPDSDILLSTEGTGADMAETATENSASLSQPMTTPTPVPVRTLPSSPPPLPTATPNPVALPTPKI